MRLTLLIREIMYWSIHRYFTFNRLIIPRTKSSNKYKVLDVSYMGFSEKVLHFLSSHRYYCYRQSMKDEVWTVVMKCTASVVAMHEIH
jgi:hypothetical protein